MGHGEFSMGFLGGKFLRRCDMMIFQGGKFLRKWDMVTFQWGFVGNVSGAFLMAFLGGEFHRKCSVTGESDQLLMLGKA